ncbi:PKD domain protein [compost metagenome]
MILLLKSMKKTPHFLSDETYYKQNPVSRFLPFVLFAWLLVCCFRVNAQGDNCDQALALTNVTSYCSGSNQYTNVGSTPSGFTPAPCWAATATSDVWFSFVALGTNVLISVNGATMQQPRIAIYSGTCSGTLTQPVGGCTNGAIFSQDAQLYNAGLVQGTTYFIRVSTTTNNRGTFQLCINSYTPPPSASADCGGAGRLCNGNPISVTNLLSGGSNVNENAGTCLSGFGIVETNSVWYTWTCETAGPLTMDIIPANQTDDIDFIIFQLNTTNPCGPRTAIRCTATSFTNSNGSTGLNATSTDVNEAVGWTGVEDGYLQQINMTAGTSYAILINNSNATNGFTLNWGGMGTFVGPDPQITGGPFTVCAGTPISFDGNTSTGYATLSWNFTDGSGSPVNASGPGPHTVSYPAPGNYTAILNAVSATGCTSVETANIVVSPEVTVTFPAVAAICNGQAAPAFPSQINSPAVPGSWSPNTISNTASGTYTFTPNPGQCAVGGTISVNVQTAVTPAFPSHPTYCLNAIPQALPATSDNGISGTWSPAAINTSVAGSNSYTFTPATGSCAAPVTISILVDNGIVPSFPAHPQYCLNEPPQPLPLTSDNGINGTWSSTSINTSSAGTVNYTFTPAPGQCASPVTIAIVVGPAPAPLFTPIPAFCNGDPAPVLPSVSNDGISGTWNPSTVSNTSGGTYTFTPGAGQCASVTSLVVTVNNPVIPNLTSVGPFCENDTDAVNLTADVTGGFWSGAGITDPAGVFDPSVAGLGTHTLTYTHTQGCGGSNTLSVVINPVPDSDFTADVTAGCSPLKVFFSSNPSVTGSSWDFGDNLTSVMVGSANHFYETAGTYSVSLTNTLNGCSSTTTLTNYITVYPDPIAGFYASPQVLLQTNTETQFTNTSQNGDSWSWTFGDGDSSSLEEPAHKFPAIPGNYNVTLTVSSPDGCTDEKTVVIIVKDDHILYVPNTFTPDGDEFNNEFTPIVTAGYDTRNYSFTLYNRWGETLFESQDVNRGWDGTYLGKLVPAGIYTWTIRIKSLDDDRYEVFTGHVNMMR